MKLVYPMLLLCLLFLNAATAQTYFVRTGGSDVNTGNSWNSSFRTIQKALSVAAPNSRIFVERGTYYPGTAWVSQAASFNLKTGVALYGGFDPDNGVTDLNHTRIFRSRLSGDLLGNDAVDEITRAENAYQVVRAEGIQDALLDGFSIESGNAFVTGILNGAGIYVFNAQVTLRNCVLQFNKAFSDGGAAFLGTASNVNFINCNFLDNYADRGAGIYSQHTATITECLFGRNTADTDGGALFGLVSMGSLDISRSVFFNNTAFRGGAVAFYNGNATVLNCLFDGNTASAGGACYNVTANTRFIHCNFTQNAANSGGAIFNVSNSSPLIRNCILWNNTAATSSPEIHNAGSGDQPQVSNSIVKGGYSGTGNKDQDPLFVSNTNLRLQECSPAIDAGDNALLPAGTLVDLDGEQRIRNNRVDMGAYEYNGQLYTYYRDADEDFQGDLYNSITIFCSVPPAGYVENGDDCDDYYVGPCTGGCETPSVLYRDLDNDGYGDANDTWNNAPCNIIYGIGTGWVENAGDCNDNNAGINPGAAEICGNGIDDNCNGQADEGCTVPVCGELTNLSTTNITATSATFNWTTGINPDVWNVRYKSTAPGSKWVDVPGVLPAHRSVTVTGLQANQNYMWHIRARCNGKEWTKYSNSIGFVTSGDNFITGTQVAPEAADVAVARLGVYPNPSRGAFVVSLQVEDRKIAPALIRVIDLNGKILQTVSAIVSNHRLYQQVVMPAHASGGMYQVQVIAGDKVYRSSLVYIR